MSWSDRRHCVAPERETGVVRGPGFLPAWQHLAFGGGLAVARRRIIRQYRPGGIMSDGVARTRGQDIRVIGLIGSAHAVSHFYQLVLPPLFPLLKDAFDVSYTELGLLATFFYAASGLS